MSQNIRLGGNNKFLQNFNREISWKGGVIGLCPFVASIIINISELSDLLLDIWLFITCKPVLWNIKLLTSPILWYILTFS
jgi:hypothetical protein